MVPGARLIILGKQGAGKGTQGVRLARHYVVPQISTGDMLRVAARSRTESALKAKEYMDAGELVPDDVMIELVQERLELDDTANRGFVLDGFPRTVHQAEALESLLGDVGGVDLALDLELETDVAFERILARRVCPDCGAIYSTTDPPHVNWNCDYCGGEVSARDDDTPDAIRRRLLLYEEQTAPLISFYLERDKLIAVDAFGHEDEVFDRLTRAIDARRRRIR